MANSLLKLQFNLSAAFRAADRLESLSPAALARIRQRAASTLGRRISVIAARGIGEVANLKRSVIRNRIRSAISETDGGSRQIIDVIGSTERLNLSFYGARWGGVKTDGATAQLFKDTPRRTYKSSFINPKSGNVLERAFRGGGAYSPSKKRHGRLPVRQLRGPSVGSLMMSEGIVSPIISAGQRILVGEVNRLIDVELRK